MTSIKKKLSVMLVLSLFILSVIPVGLADEGSNEGSNNIVEVELDADLDEDQEDAEVETESKTEIETEDNDSEVKEKIKIKTETKDGKVKVVKEVKREVKLLRKDLQQAREKLEEAKERFREAKDEQREHRLKILDLDKVVKRCKEDKENCAELKLKLRLGVEQHLLKSVQVVERSLEKLTKTVEKMEDLSEEEKASALDMIAGFQAELDAQKAKIEAFTTETSQEEIRAAIKDLKELNQKVHKMQRRLVGLLVNAKLHVLVEKQAELHAGMQARIDALAETGADVSALEELLADFDAKVEELKQDYEAAQQQWMEAKDSEDFDQFNRDLRDAQHKVREDLQEIKKILRKFLAEYKEIKEGSDEVEAENESEESPENESEDSESINESTEVETNTSVEVNASVETNTSANVTA